jgi:hypothetical protein
MRLFQPPAFAIAAASKPASTGSRADLSGVAGNAGDLQASGFHLPRQAFKYPRGLVIRERLLSHTVVGEDAPEQRTHSRATVSL